jgi:hypothetical protein
MRISERIGPLSLVIFGLAGVAWFSLETAAPRLGFEDTDSPAVSLRFLQAHPESYAQAGVILFVMAIALTMGVLAASDRLPARPGEVAVRTLSAFGLFAAAFLFALGVLRLSVRPLLYIDSLDQDWGEAAYLVVQLMGTHGFAEAALTALCIWAAGLSVVGFRTKALPAWLCALGLVPAFRLLSILGPLGVATDIDGLWIFFIASIPGALVWCVALGVVLFRAAAPDVAASGAARAAATTHA